ncbi:hypothetical protein CHCC14600_0205 [Bacillus licheniformis]|uniref:hypothetical protein n=1 Tax=Bacillus TaxID=1386 RepID=UPI0009B7AE36|nr:MULTISPECIES: hypothetical protein [Bacillus]ARC72577.1 hypothetical protein B37_00524 [Bacillus licheniformis]ARW41712.1 hypothetical protein S100141_00389 [Bacillus licheniformis]ARW56562.1 hypothetical protein S100027_04598 [Bacillus licheniformis]AXF87831.1 hypothetical protein BLDA23_05900 [Bacillus licheniformis]KAA6475790.1 hypothetical protein DX928_06710 [Bacillus swezeyi]
MIKMNITGLNELKKLSEDLKKLKQHVNRQSQWAVESLYKSTTTIYERHIYDLVYEEYDPVVYERTYHLLGGHGAKDEKINLAGPVKSYDFSIDENSRDPVDGTTWGQKANAIEHGSTEMYFKHDQTPFNRPFVQKTQEALEWENKRTADAFERSVNAIINRITRG